jgi:hypothetical protein
MPLQAEIGHVQFNLCAQNEHVPEIKRFIRTVKDRTRSGYHSLPFKRIPRLIVIRLVSNGVFWRNAFPHKDGVSSTLSPRYLMTGKHLDFTKHVRAEFGAYVQTHEQHSNNVDACTIGAICLGPSGNEQGGHWFYPYPLENAFIATDGPRYQHPTTPLNASTLSDDNRVCLAHSRLRIASVLN